MDLFKVKKSVSDSLREYRSDLDFKYELDDDDSLVIKNEHLKMCGDGVSLFCTIKAIGEVRFVAIFDELELNINTAKLMNKIQERSIFQTLINSKGYLCFKVIGYTANENEVGPLFTLYLSYLSNLSALEEMKEITKLTN